MTAELATDIRVDRLDGRDRTLDGLRALAAVAVVITHSLDWSDFVASTRRFDLVPGSGSFPGGLVASWVQQLNVGVEVFFVISAVLLYRPFVTRHLRGDGSPGLGTYALRRFLRIYPAYWVALAIILPLSPTFGLFNWWQRLSAPLLVHTYRFEGLGASVGLRQAWTLVVEVSFYLFLPVYAAAIRALGRRAGALRAELIGALALVVIGPAFHVLVDRNSGWSNVAFALKVLPPKLGIFGAGLLLAIAAAVAPQAQGRTRAWLRIPAALFALGVAVFAGVEWILSNDPGVGRFAALMPASVLAGLALLAALGPAGRVREGSALHRAGSSPLSWLAIAAALFWFLCARVSIAPTAAYALSGWQQFQELLLKTGIGFCVVAAATLPRATTRSRTLALVGARPLAFVGMISYGIYLWHYAAIEFVGTRIGCDPARLLTPGQSICDAGASNSFVKLALAAIAGSIALGALSWYLVERPSIRLAHRIGRRPTAEPAAPERPSARSTRIAAATQAWLGTRDRAFYLGLGLIALGALAFRLWYVHAQIGRLVLNGDAFYYHYQAHDIAAGRWFIEPGMYQFFGREMPSAGHPPVYLLYLAFWTKLGIDSETAHRYLSCFLGAGGVFVVGLVGRRVWDERVGLLSAAIAAVYAHLWINDEMHMSESAYVLTAALMVLWIYRYWNRPTVANAALMGAGIALAALTRAEAMALFAFLVIPFTMSRRRCSSWKDRFSRLFACWIVGGLMLLPWFAYNVTRFEHPVTMSNGIGSVLMVANCDVWVMPDGTLEFIEQPGDPRFTDESYAGTYRGQYRGYWSIACGQALDRQIDLWFSGEKARTLHEELGGDESQREVVWRAIGLHNISQHLSDLPLAVVQRVARMWDLPPFMGQNIGFNGHLEGRGVWQSTLATWQYVAMLPFSIAGLVALRRRRRPVLPFLAIAGVVTFTAAMTFGITRYRAPVDTLMPVLAAIGWMWAWGARGRLRERLSRIATAVTGRYRSASLPGLLAVVTLLALGGRVAYVLATMRGAKPWGDAVSYHFGANLLADGYGFIDPIRHGFGIDTPSAYHPPLYTTYLAAWSWIGIDGPLAHRVVSCLLGAATVWCVGLLGARLGGDDPNRRKAIGVLAAVLAALYPHLWLNDAMLLSESAAALAIVLAVLALLRLLERPSLGRAAVLGAACGVAALGRAEMVLLFPLAVLSAAWIAAGNPRSALNLALVAGLSGLAVIGPWVGYNLTRFDEPVLLSTGLGATLTGGSCDAAFYGPKLGYWDGAPGCFAPQVPLADLIANPGLEGDESVREKQARQYALDYLETHTRRLPTVVAARVGRIWGLFRPLQTAKLDGIVEGRGLTEARLALGSYFVLAGTAIVGLLDLRRRRITIWPYLVLVAIVTLSAALAFGVQRYRIPVDVVLPALAAAGVVCLAGRRTGTLPDSPVSTTP